MVSDCRNIDSCYLRRHFMKKAFLLIGLFLIALHSIAKEADGVAFRGHIVTEKDKLPLEYAAVYLSNTINSYSGISDDNGQFIIPKVKEGIYKLQVSFVGFTKYEKTISLQRDTVIELNLQSSLTQLEEVVVTATESRSITSSTIIRLAAMEHLQPSSFTDLMELLPGGKAKDPVLTSSNLATIREVGRSGDKYAISSLGTAFLIDGIPLSANANMQQTAGVRNDYGADNTRSTVNRGVDMRSISTDQIERVEIVRGLASVRYGDLTSGLIKIERKRGVNPLDARFKVDQLSKLFALGKGFNVSANSILNLGGDYLDSKADPTNRVENYQRINVSARLSTEWDKEAYRLRWNTNFDFGHTMDNEKVDPEEGYEKTDRYKSSYNRMAVSNQLEWIFKQSSIIKSLDFLTSVSYELSKIKQKKLFQITEPTALPNTTEQGVSDGIYLPGKWVSDLTVDGKPLYIYSNLNSKLAIRTASVVHNVQAGIEWTFEKNYGDGQVYDVTRPPGAGMSTRPRAYVDIPAAQNVAFYLEDDVSIPVGTNKLKLNPGVRTSSMPGLDSKYRMSGKIYVDPRFNAEWTFPSVAIKGKPLTIALGGGLGWQSKNPTLDYLYPDWRYNDLVQLNYYHNNPDFRRINLMTYKNKFVNYNLEPSRNRKWEVKLSMDYDNNNFMVTYFREKMTNGFRSEVTNFQIQEYKEYDPNSVNSQTLTGPPDLNEMAYVTDTLIALYGMTGNGTVIKKEGIEFVFASKRFERSKTRITFNGAWFKSHYGNNIPVYRAAQRTVNGIHIKERGVYKTSDGLTREVLNTNLKFDTYIPVLDLNFSTSFQAMWYSLKTIEADTRMPYAFIDKKGEMHPYTEVELNDLHLSTLYSPGSSTTATGSRKEKVPFEMDINFKMTKRIRDRVMISIFVNRLLDYRPDYTVNGFTYHRNRSPYFGAEMNIKF